MLTHSSTMTLRQQPFSAVPSLMFHLFSSDSDTEEDGVRQVRIDDHGSRQQYANVNIEGVPATGVIDSGAEITIINGKLFARIAAVARLKKSRLKPPDRIPKTYDRRVFTLDGRMDLDIGFDGITMRTPIYIKVDAVDQLLLGEGVCSQLKIITYHSSVFSIGKQRVQQETKTLRAPENTTASNTKRQGFTKKTKDSGRRLGGPTATGGSGNCRSLQGVEKTQREPGEKCHRESMDQFGGSIPEVVQLTDRLMKNWHKHPQISRRTPGYRWTRCWTKTIRA